MSNQVTVEKRESVDNVIARPERTRSGRAYSPPVDIIEKPEELLVLADMPGASSENIDVSFENGLLTILAKVSTRHSPEAGYLLREYGVGDFYRSFQIGEGIDANRISAEVRNGVLTLHLPKSEAVKPKRIVVKGQ